MTPAAHSADHTLRLHMRPTTVNRMNVRFISLRDYTDLVSLWPIPAHKAIPA